ncbi:hypothetical protein RND71_010332 [Anisodus tanguticus]|uniref:Uncharacterized protein n=1 Tax=Anisodus tanguticus TaxID=243964 RepID=A0AAE1SJC8_9SOLA|nr:hypothetical protein RND71_010332 [Anisodus tanguticus]
MMRSPFVIFIFLFNFLQLLDPTFSLPLCTDSRAPLQLKAPLAFCPYNGTSCCNSADDKQLQTQFNAMNISDPGCASLVKSIVCAKCDKFSAELFRTNSIPRQLPILCNSTTSANSTLNSPFATSAKSNSTKFTDQWKSQTDFCSTFGGASGDGSVCFAGEPVTLNTTTPLSPPGEDSGIFNTTEISFNCAKRSPIECTFVPGSSVPALGYIFSYGEDNNKDMYILASSGIYRVVRPSRCKYACAKENSSAVIDDIPADPPAASPSAAIMLTGSYNNFVLMFLSFMLMLASWF